MDELDKRIEAKRWQVSALKRYAADPAAIRADLVAAEAALQAFELAAQLRPAVNGGASHETKDEPQKKRGGKPAGAISQPWRNLLQRMYTEGNPYRSEEWILAAAKKVKIGAKPRGIIDRLSRKYVSKLDFLEYEEGQGYRVTD